MSHFTLPFARSLHAPAAATVALALTGAGLAQAADNRHLAYSFTEPATPGLKVSGTLGEQFRAVAGARVVVPGQWRRLSARPGRLRFLNARGTSCSYRVTFTAKSRLAPADDPQQVAAAGLPAPGPRYLLDSGVRGGRAFRVVRARTSGGVRVDAVSTGILTRRADIAPSGQVAWGEIRVTATSSPGDECHSGTYREALGPQIGDALATAKARLKFVAPG